jgi:hypothetical protein
VNRSAVEEVDGLATFTPKSEGIQDEICEVYSWAENARLSALGVAGGREPLADDVMLTIYKG